MSDIIPVPGTVGTIVIENYSISDLTWIVPANYSFNFYVDTNIVANSKFIIEFPNPWIDKNKTKDPITCTFEGIEVTCK